MGPLGEARLGIAGAERVARGQGGSELAPHEREDGLQAAVQVDRAEHRLEEVGEDALLAGAAAALLAPAEARVLAELELARALGEGDAVHERRARAREVALRPVRVGLVEEAGDGEPEHRVPQELEPLVAVPLPLLVGAGRVRERGAEQLRIGEAMAEPCLDRAQRRTERVLRRGGAQASGPAIQPPPSTRSPS